MAGSVLGWAPGRAGQGIAKGEEERAKLWGVLLSTGYGGDRECPSFFRVDDQV